MAPPPPLMVGEVSSSSKRRRPYDSGDEMLPSKRHHDVTYLDRSSRAKSNSRTWITHNVEAESDASDDSLVDKSKTSLGDALARAPKKKLIALCTELCQRRYRQFITSAIQTACDGNGMMEDWIIQNLTHGELKSSQAAAEDADISASDAIREDLLAKFLVPVPKRKALETKQQRSSDLDIAITPPIKQECAHYHELNDPWPEGKTGECHYHPGKLIWANTLDSGQLKWAEVKQSDLFMASRLPQNFAWTCCKRDAKSDPCELGWHTSEAPVVAEETLSTGKAAMVEEEESSEYDQPPALPDESSKISSSNDSDIRSENSTLSTSRRSTRRLQTDNRPALPSQRSSTELFSNVPDVTPGMLKLTPSDDIYPQALRQDQAQRLDLSSDPLRHLLDPSELLLAEHLRFSCAKYLYFKRRIFLYVAKSFSSGSVIQRTVLQDVVCSGISRARARTLRMTFEESGFLERSYYESHIKLRYLSLLARQKSSGKSSGDTTNTVSPVSDADQDQTSAFEDFRSTEAALSTDARRAQQKFSAPQPAPNGSRPLPSRSISAGSSSRDRSSLTAGKKSIWNTKTMEAVVGKAGSKMPSTDPARSLPPPPPPPDPASAANGSKGGMTPSEPLSTPGMFRFVKHGPSAEPGGTTPSTPGIPPTRGNPFQTRPASSSQSLSIGGLAQRIFGSIKVPPPPPPSQAPREPRAVPATVPSSAERSTPPSSAATATRQKPGGQEMATINGRRYPVYCVGNEGRHAAARRSYDHADIVFTPDTGCKKCRSRGHTCYFISERGKCAYCIAQNQSKAICAKDWAEYPGTKMPS